MAILQRTSHITEQVLIALTNAEKEIVFQTYYVDNDSIFAKYAEILITKAKQGVSIHCLFDALGASQIPGSAVEKMLSDAGVHIQYFNWLTPWAPKSKNILYFRNHKRVLIIDRVSLHIGGWCIGEKTEHWIDGHTIISDQSVIQSGLLDFWNMYKYAKKTQIRFKNEARYVYKNEDLPSYVYQAPIPRGRYAYYTHKHLMQNASEKIVLVTPYFAPVHILKTAIYKARKKGIAVEIFLPKKTDTRLTDLVAKTYIHGLLKRGASVYLSSTMIHAKTILFDKTLYVGSMNFDAVSQRYNFENGIYTQDQKHIDEFMQDIAGLKNTCTQVTLAAWENRTLWERFLDKFMKLFRAFV